MKLFLLGETFEFENKLNSYNEIFILIENKLADKDVYFSHLKLDGKEIYNDFEMYFNDQLNSINKVEVVVQSIEQFTCGIISSIHEYLSHSLIEVNSTLDEFYQSPQEETWGKYLTFLDGISMVHQGIMSIDRSKHQPKNWEEYLVLATSMQKEFISLEEALKQNDPILVADITNYEIIPILKAIQKQAQLTLEEEVGDKGAN